MNPAHYSNSQESIKFIEEILVPYFTKKRRDLGLNSDQKGILIFDVFTGQMTSDVKEVVEKHNFIVKSYQIGSVRPSVCPSICRDWLIRFFLKLSMVLGAQI